MSTALLNSDLGHVMKRCKHAPFIAHGKTLVYRDFVDVYLDNCLSHRNFKTGPIRQMLSIK